MTPRTTPNPTKLLCVATTVVLAFLSTASATSSPIEFPVGYEKFHKDKVYNFQLNRFHSMGYIGHDRLVEAGGNIDSFDSWKTEMLRQAQLADDEGRLMEAAYFYRAAEFYLRHDDPDKVTLHRTFVERFDQAFADVPFERFEVPYGGAALPVLRLAASGETEGTIVMHGGFDSFAEEFAAMMISFSDRGYDVVLFEGPGQGAARRVHGLAFDPAWEKPTSAVLDHFDLDDVTLLGVSMGGYLCLRAAAHEPRISRVIASSIAYDYPSFPGPLGQAIARAFLTRYRDFTNKVSLAKIDKGGIEGWSIDNMMYITDQPTPVEAIDVTWSMDKEFLGSERVTQDVLILTGRNDHFVPFKMHKKQVEALTNARSVSDRIFTARENADQHCQIGNIGLAVEVMLDWLDQLEVGSQPSAAER
jgi:pimeloyl-ACP methyl ester carboxylesterase